MENASKALLMAATMLISVLILALAVYLFSTFGAQAVQINKENEIKTLRQFNEQFTIYEEQSGKNTIYDVITVANVAKNNNKYYGFIRKNNSGQYVLNDNIELKLGKDNYIKIRIKGESIENKGNDDYDSLIKDNSNKFYNCKVNISTTTGRVYEVNFNEP